MKFIIYNFLRRLNKIVASTQKENIACNKIINKIMFKNYKSVGWVVVE